MDRITIGFRITDWNQHLDGFTGLDHCYFAIQMMRISMDLFRTVHSNMVVDLNVPLRMTYSGLGELLYLIVHFVLLDYAILLLRYFLYT